MEPLDVEQLFRQTPELFAYKLPTVEERSQARPGDLVKLFLHDENYVHPRPTWFIVATNAKRTKEQEFTATIWQGYGKSKQNLLPRVQFNASHIYRLPLSRPEIANPSFDAVMRDQKRDAG